MAVRSGPPGPPQAESPPMADRVPWLSPLRLALIAVAAVVVILAISWRVCAVDPRAHFLARRAPAEWIIYPTPAFGEAVPLVDLTTEFGRTFILAAPTRSATLSVCGFKTFQIRLNGQPVSAGAPSNWKHVSQIEIAQLLRSGTNELQVAVTCAGGLPALWAHLKAGDLALSTDESWSASLAGGSWQLAQRASTPLAIRPGNRLYSSERCWLSLRDHGWGFLGLAVLGIVPVLILKFLPARARPPLVCLGVVALAWVALWTNNLGRLPREIGFDTAEHMAYIKYICDKGTLPLANEGWEMYQPPLYYVISAGLLKLLQLAPVSAAAAVTLRLFGLACGIAAVVFVFLSIRSMYPDRPRAQILGLGLTAFLPVNLYLYQYVTNETLAATMGAAALYVTVWILSSRRAGLLAYSVLGLVLGLALLTKSSTLLVLPVIVAVLSWHLVRTEKPAARNCSLRLGIMLLTCMAVCGWHYYRTFTHFGTPLLGNWDPRSGFMWWQEPGYRTTSSFVEFGRALKRPFYSAFAGVPDGLYSTLWGDGLYGGGADYRVRPPWNYTMVTAGYLFALGPTLLFLFGFVILAMQFARQPRPATLLMLGVLATAAALLAWYAVKVPSYASAKAFYVLPALVPFGVVAAAGAEKLSGAAGHWRWVMYCVLALWASNAFGSVWIRHNTVETKVLTARTYAAENQPAAAVREAQALLETNPRNAAAAQLLAVESAGRGQFAEAANFAREAVAWAPDDPEAHLIFATMLFQQGRADEAIAEARRTLELAPDHPKAPSSLFAWLYRLGRKTDAAAMCAEALRVDPFNPQLHQGMARVARDLGDNSTALMHTQIAEDLKRHTVRH